MKAKKNIWIERIDQKERANQMNEHMWHQMEQIMHKLHKMYECQNCLWILRKVETFEEKNVKSSKLLSGRQD